MSPRDDAWRAALAIALACPAAACAADQPLSYLRSSGAKADAKPAADVQADTGAGPGGDAGAKAK